MESKSSREDLEQLRTLVDGIEFAMLTTESEDGKLHSRPMATQELDVEGTCLWFFTSDPSPKTREVAVESRVNVSYAASRGHRYVSVSGSAEVVTDATKIHELWRESHKIWFPKGLDDPNLALLKVNIEEAQFWDSPGRVSAIFKFAKAYLSQEKFEGGQVKKMNFENHVTHS